LRETASIKIRPILPAAPVTAIRTVISISNI
jgi:hypothetical protein